jgi:N-methylhydantoinase A
MTAEPAAAGVDVGGTFTDLVAIASDGAVHARKVLTTPADQGVAVADALSALGDRAGKVERVVHGTTVVTNLLLERAGARVVLCATEGATDILELRRQDRASLYDLSARHPESLVAAADVVAVRERVSANGVVTVLGADEAERVAASIAALKPEIVAVALLHSYAFPEHEQLLGDVLRRRLPDVEVVLSCEVLPEPREYERTATTAAEAYARPRVAAYLRRLEARLAEVGAPAPSVMTSSGGSRTASEASRHAASLALSGPAGGVVGAAHVARRAGISRALTIDIGGTSADAGLIVDGAPLVEAGGSVAGVPIALPRVVVETVSAGGGSIAWIDPGGALRVGPRSAGAEPGPAAFGRGGTLPTVTDAHVVLGHIGIQGLSGGLQVDVDAARSAIAALARALDTDPVRVAGALLDVVDAEMARALRRVSVERGIDPRSCTLVAFGGGGPLHACSLAARLSMTRVFVPPHAGVLSAYGLAIAVQRRESIVAVGREATLLDAEAVSAVMRELRERAGQGAVREYFARARYEGQGHELEVAFDTGDDGAALAGRFEMLHRERYGFGLELPVVVVTARHSASDPGREPGVAKQGGRGEAITGPRVIPLDDATLRVAEGWTATPQREGGWMLECSPCAIGSIHWSSWLWRMRSR